MNNAQDLSAEAYASALAVVNTLELPPGTALAATGSFARNEMTGRSDLDLILLHPQGEEPAEAEIEQLWYPVWDAKYHLDFALRTPQECGDIAAQDASAGFAQLDLAYVAGEEALFEDARARVLRAWRRQIQGGFDAFVDSAIARWRRSGAVSSMTNPDLKNGRGGLRDIQLLRALALGNLCDLPDLSEEKALLLHTRALLHMYARRHRDTLDPEFAADIAQDLGFADRYELTSALVVAATTVERELEKALAIARGVVGHRGATTRSQRRPLDVDVIDAGGVITLSRNPNLDDPWLVIRAAAASARTGLPISQATWGQLQAVPAPPPRWTKAAVEDFFAILSSPENTSRVIRELDEHGLWQNFVPDWGHIRGLLPRERTHIHSVDAHSIATVAACAAERTTVARPDLLLLTALFHDMGKGYGRPHEEVGAELVLAQAQRMQLGPVDRSRVETVVAEHTTLARLASSSDPYADETRDALLGAAHYDRLTIKLLRVLAKADAQSTGPGVWTPRIEQAITIMTERALEALEPRTIDRPQVHDFAGTEPVALEVDWDEQVLRISWKAVTDAPKTELKQVLALIAAMGWTVVRADVVRGEDGTYRAAFAARVQQQTLADAADETHFIQSYKSGRYSELPDIVGEPTTVQFAVGEVLEVRTVERRGALAHVLMALPEVEWLSQEVLGATMIVHVKLPGEFNRTSVVAAVTRALARS